jgi:hypothetical protein
MRLLAAVILCAMTAWAQAAQAPATAKTVEAAPGAVELQMRSIRAMQESITRQKETARKQAAATPAGFLLPALADAVAPEPAPISATDAEPETGDDPQLAPLIAAPIAVPAAPARGMQDGARLLMELLTRFGGDLKQALSAYNAGPAAPAAKPSDAKEREKKK